MTSCQLVKLTTFTRDICGFHLHSNFSRTALNMQAKSFSEMSVICLSIIRVSYAKYLESSICLHDSMFYESTKNLLKSCHIESKQKNQGEKVCTKFRVLEFLTNIFVWAIKT